jgi:tetratricopeptide (TPR) repeat protein
MTRIASILAGALACSVSAQSTFVLHAAEAAAAFKQARALEDAKLAEPINAAPADVDEVVKAYQRAASLGSTDQSALAWNDLGVLYLKLDRPKDAVKALREATEANSSSATYQFNLGRALEAVGDRAGALQQYRAALKKRGAPASAQRAALRVTSTAAEAAEVVELLLDGKNYRVARDGARDALVAAAARKEDGAARLLPLYAQALVALETTPDEFREAEWPKLEPLARANGHQARQLAQLRDVILDPPEKQTDVPMTGATHGLDIPRLLQAFTKDWSLVGAEQVAMHGLLHFYGRQYDRAEQPESAAVRFAMAWARDPHDLEAVTEFADVLQTHPKALEPAQPLLQPMVRSLFKMKGPAYVSNDWEQVTRLHLTLGQVFGAEKKWLPENDPNTALYHYLGALEADRQRRLAGPAGEGANTEMTAGLYAALGEAWEASGHPEQAWNYYLEAAERFAAQGNWQLAEAASVRCRATGKRRWTPGTSERLDVVEGAGQQLKESCSDKVCGVCLFRGPDALSVNTPFPLACRISLGAKAEVRSFGYTREKVALSLVMNDRSEQRMVDGKVPGIHFEVDSGERGQVEGMLVVLNCGGATRCDLSGVWVIIRELDSAR